MKTFIEVVRTGKRVRWYGQPLRLRQGGIVDRDTFVDPSFFLQHVDVPPKCFADPWWETEERKVPITNSQFWEAVRASTSVAIGQEISLTFDDITKLAKKLGLEDYA